MAKYIFKRYPAGFFNITHNINDNTDRAKLIDIINEDFKAVGNVKFGQTIVQEFFNTSRTSIFFPTGTAMVVDIACSINDNNYLHAFVVWRVGETLQEKAPREKNQYYNYNTMDMNLNTGDLNFRHKVRSPVFFICKSYYDDKTAFITYDSTKTYSLAPLVHPTYGVFPGMLACPILFSYEYSSSVIPYDGKKYYIGHNSLSENTSYGYSDEDQSSVLYCTESFETTPV